MHIMELGEFSVTYRVSGLLAEVKHLITARSRLRGCVMDALHREGIEIVSPNFMNTRSLQESTRIIPKPTLVDTHPVSTTETAPEDVVFDKAEEAESLETLQKSYDQLNQEIESLREQIGSVKEEEKKKLEYRIARMEERKHRLETMLAEKESD